MSSNIDLGSLPTIERGVQGLIHCKTVTAQLAQQGGYDLTGDVTASTIGTRELSVGMVFMPADGQSMPHMHQSHEIAILFLHGWSVTASGHQLEHLAVHGPGDFKYVGAGIPHMGINLSPVESVIGVESRSDPNFNEDVVVLDHLAERANEVAEYVRRHIRPETDFGLTGIAWLQELIAAS